MYVPARSTKKVRALETALAETEKKFSKVSALVYLLYKTPYIEDF